MSIRTFLWVAIVAATISFTLGFTQATYADSRMVSSTGVCQFQIGRNNPNRQVVSGTCPVSIYLNGQGEADGAVTQFRRYPRGKTPIGNVRALIIQRNNKAQRPPGSCRFPQPFPTEPTPVPGIGQVGRADDLLCRMRITGELANNEECTLIVGNTTYKTQFWTGHYEVYGDGLVVYRLDCRDAVPQN